MGNMPVDLMAEARKESMTATENIQTVYRARVISGMALGVLMLTMFGGLWLADGLFATHSRPLWPEVFLVIVALFLLACSLKSFAAKELDTKLA